MSSDEVPRLVPTIGITRKSQPSERKEAPNWKTRLRQAGMAEDKAGALGRS